MQKLGREFSVVYYWYHHMMPSFNREKIRTAIKTGDYKLFRSLQDEWNNKYEDMIFLPTYATLWYNDRTIGEIYLTSEEGFKLIDYEESECG